MSATVRIFLASPWDTADARAAVAQAVVAVRAEPAYRDQVQLDLRRWDDDLSRPVPVSFRRNPQADVVEYVGDPADCDLVVGLFRHVFGSPLPESDYGLSPDDDPWTGTEWEIHRALSAGSRVREVWIFRDEATWVDDKSLSRDQRNQRWAQHRAVDDYFDTCRDERGSILRGFLHYRSPEDLKEKFIGRLREWLHKQFLASAPGSNPAAAAPATAQAEPLTAEQQRLFDILVDNDEPLDRALVAVVYAAPVRGLRGYLLHRFAAWCVADMQLDLQFVNLDLLVEQKGADAEHRYTTVRHASLQALLASDAEATRGWVLIGEPGGGKSTVLQHHELLMARAGLRALARGEPLPELCLWQRLADYPHAEPDPGAWLQAQWQALYPHLPPLAEWAHTHRMRWLLDGLNEIQAPDGAAFRACSARLARWAAALPAEHHAAPIFSVRTLDYSATLSVPGFTVKQIRLAAWTPAQIEQCCTLRLGPGNALWPAVERDPKLLELCALPFHLDAQCGLTDALGRPAADRVELFEGMSWQRLRRAETRRELDHPALLTDREHAQLADERFWIDHLAALPEQGQLLPGLDRQARQMHRASDGTEVSVDEREVAPWLRDAPGVRAAWLKAAQALHFAQVELSGRFRYSHQLWQEFFAARGLRDLDHLQEKDWPDLRPPELTPLADLELGTQDPLPGPGVSAWEEPVKMAVQMAARRDPAVARRWIERVQRDNLALAGRAAVRCLSRLQGSAELDVLRAALLARSRDASVDVRLRIEAGHILGELGDPRYEERVGPDGQRYLWPRQWVAIPGGVYRIGNDTSDDEGPVTEVRLAPYAMAFAPLTNAEYRCFVEANGYGEERWWDGDTARRWRREGIRNDQSINDWRTWLAALREPGQFDAAVSRYFPSAPEAYIETELRKYAAWSPEQAERELEASFGANRQDTPLQWHDPVFNGPNQPVVGICQFEALAYAKWLSHQSGRDVRLPSEAQWEAAARGAERRRWPWGGPDPEPGTMNADPAHLRRTSPVGVFPQADSPDGLTDLAGNVWEWTTSLYTDRHDAQALTEPAPEGLARRVVRGGAWDDPSVGCRAACRGGDSPGGRGDYLGLRLVVSGPIPGAEP